MKNKTIATLILATTLSVGGLSYAVAATTTESGATTTQSCTMKEDGSGKHKGGKHKGEKHGKNMGFQKLDLSDTQKQEMKTIMTAHKEAKKEVNKALKVAHKAEIQALMTEATFDEAKASELIAQHQELRAESALSMLKVKHEMFQLLTDEQKVEYNERQMKRNHR